MERKSRPLPRPGDELALRLREAMDASGLTAKELSRRIASETDYRLDFRTIQNAMGGGCSLDSFAVLSAYFGWDFSDGVLEPVHGATRLAALEREIERDRSIMAARERELARLQAANRAHGSAVGGQLRLVADEDRPWPARDGRGAAALGGEGGE